MKANEFVKKFGWNDARVCILNCACPEDRWLMRHGNLLSDQDFDDLKRLVESHELIEQYNGLFEAKELIRVSPKMTSELREVAAAIADVESCQ